MEFLNELIHNPLFVAPAIGWTVAQFLKVIIYMAINKSFRADRIFGSGGMPSSHSATVCALLTATGIELGGSGFAFPMALFFAFVVMYDAIGVRRETGEQAKVLNEMIKLFTNMGKSLTPREQLKEFVGHSPLQVACGAVLGVLIGVAVCFCM